MAGVDCECQAWATDLPTIGHHYNCDRFQARHFVEAVYHLIAAMEDWSLDGDGIHPEAWDAYMSACRLIGRESAASEGGA